MRGNEGIASFLRASGIRTRLGVDLRSLAALRISLGLILIADLLLRTRNLRTFYTDAGVLPVSALAEQTPLLARFSLHAQSGEAWFQILLFAIAFVVAAALVVGYRTRLTTALSLLLLLTLHARNPHIISSGDSLLQHLLFWSLFLPLGKCWSVDAQQERNNRDRVSTAASAGILLQIVILYSVNAVLKLRSEAWMTGDAVSAVIGIDRLTVLLGPVIREFPLLLEIANWTWVCLLVAAPLLVLSTGRVRMLLVFAFAVMHFGMLLTMHIGIFPAVSMIALIPFLPRRFWEGVENSRIFSWIHARLGSHLLDFADTLPQKTVKRSAPNTSRRVAGQIIPAMALVGIIIFNAMAIGFVPVPAPVDDSVSEEVIDSRWSMFAPPPATDRWIVAPAELDNGTHIDAFHQSKLDWERPDDIAETYSSARERKFMSNLRGDASLRPRLLQYLCDRWNRNHDSKINAVSLYAVETPPLTSPDDSRERVELAQSSCNSLY